MLLAVLPISALANESGLVIQNGVLTEYQGFGGVITIPDNVVAIGNYAFENFTNMTSVIIPDSVTTIGDCAFKNCHNLIHVRIPSSLTTLGG